MADTAQIMLMQAMNQLSDQHRAEFQMAYMSQRKDRGTALVLSLFLGLFGIDRFYLGQVGLGVCKLLFGWLTLYIWPLIDIFLIMGATDRHNVETIQQLQLLYRN